MWPRILAGGRLLSRSCKHGDCRCWGRIVLINLGKRSGTMARSRTRRTRRRGGGDVDQQSGTNCCIGSCINKIVHYKGRDADVSMPVVSTLQWEITSMGKSASYGGVRQPIHSGEESKTCTLSQNTFWRTLQSMLVEKAAVLCRVITVRQLSVA